MNRVKRCGLAFSKKFAEIFLIYGHSYTKSTRGSTVIGLRVAQKKKKALKKGLLINDLEPTKQSLAETEGFEPSIQV
jgi:hypothetical protein